MHYSNFQSSRHIKQRMSQRGISREMLNLVLQHGEPRQDCKVVLGRKEAQNLLCQMQQTIKVLKKIVDKGGVTVVEKNSTLITTYNNKA